VYSNNKEIILGAAQFGDSYGISNSYKRLKRTTIIKILLAAIKNGITKIDVSDSYFNSSIKKIIKKFNFEICFKIPSIKTLNIEEIKEVINSNIRHYKKIYSISIHSPKDLLLKKKIKQVINYLHLLKKKKLIKKIGISIYNEKELYLATKIFNKKLDLIQIPINLVDQRFAKKKIVKKIKDLKLEVHARSIFLQGLLLMKSKDKPKYFKRWDKEFVTYDKLTIKKKKIMCLNFVKQLNFINALVIGFLSPNQLNNIYLLEKKYKYVNLPKDINIRSNEIKLINPTKWKK